MIMGLIMPIIIIVIVIVVIRVAGAPIFEKATNAVSEAGKKAAYDVDIKNINNKINDAYEQIGNVVIEKDLKINNLEIKEALNKIDELQKQIDNLEKIK